MSRYKTTKVFKKTGYRKTIETGLTKDEAQKAVDKDLENNPKALRYMLVYDEQ